MANWAVGTLRIRGSEENVLRFLRNGFKNTRDNTCLEKKHGVIESSDDDYLLLDMDNDVVYAHAIWMPRQAPYASAELKIKGGGFRDNQHLVNVARKYNVDFRLRYIESGNAIDEFIEIIDGHITKFCDNHYGNFMWGCDFPNMG